MENPIAFTIVVISIIVTFFIAWYSRRWTRTTTEFYVAGGKIPWRLNGLAMLGDYVSAASFLGVAGAIALAGIDSWWIALGFFGAWIVVLLVLAGPLKNTGKFTVGDILTTRFTGPTVKMLAMIITVIIGTLYLVPQIVGAGHLFKLLLGWEYLTTVVVVGALMGALVIIGGMRGTSYNQALQGAIFMLAMAALLILATIVHFGGNPLSILAMSENTVSPVAAQEIAKDVLAAQNNEAEPFALAETIREKMPDAPTAMTPGVAVPNVWNQLSLVLGLLLGVLGLPHILIRFYTVRDAKTAQKSAGATIIGLAIFYAMIPFVGLAAMSLLYPDLINLLIAGERGKATNMAVPMLGELLAGEPFMGIIATGAMAAMTSTSIGLLISMTTSLAHDVYAGVFRPESSEKERLVFAKAGAAAFTLIAILASIWLKDQNVAVLVGMCFGIASSTFAPVLVAAVWWKKLTKEGVIAAMAIGLIVSLVFTFARFLGIPSVLGLPVLVSPALYGVTAALAALIVISYLTKNVGRAEEVMALAHRE